MPTTATRGYPYPSLTDPANGPAAFQSLAQAIETDVGSVDTHLTTVEQRTMRPASGVTQSATQALTSGVWTRITSYTVDANFAARDGGLTLDTGCLVVPKTGAYLVTANISVPTTAGGTRRGVGIDVANAIADVFQDARSLAQLQAASTAAMYQNISGVLYATAGQYIRAFGYADAAGITLLTSPATRFSAAFIS